MLKRGRFYVIYFLFLEKEEILCRRTRSLPFI